MDVRFPTKTKYAAKSLAARVMGGDVKSIGAFMLLALKQGQSAETGNAITERFKGNKITPNNYALLVESIDVRIEKAKFRLSDAKKALADTIKSIRSVPGPEYFSVAMRKREEEIKNLSLAITEETLHYNRAKTILDTLDAWWSKARHVNSGLTAQERAYWKKFFFACKKELQSVIVIMASNLSNLQARLDTINTIERWNLKRRRAVAAVARNADIERVKADAEFSIADAERTLERLQSFKERLALYVRFLEGPILRDVLNEKKNTRTAKPTESVA